MTDTDLAGASPRCPFCGEPLAVEHPSTCSNCKAARHADGYWASAEYPGAKMAADGTPWARDGSNRTPLLIGLAVTALLIGGGLVAFLLTRSSDANPTMAAAPVPTGHTITGKMTVFDEDYRGGTLGSSCSTSGGYSDVGGQVIVKNGRDETIGIGSFSPGRFVDPMKELDPSSTIEGVSAIGCQFTVSISEVPSVPVYRIVIGHRTPFEISKADMEADGWKFDLTLGDISDTVKIR